MKSLRILALLGAAVGLLFIGLLIYTFVESHSHEIETAWEKAFAMQVSPEHLVGLWRNEAERSNLVLTDTGEFTETFQQDIADSIAKYSIDYTFRLDHHRSGKWTLSGRTLRMVAEGDKIGVSHIDINTATYAAAHGEEAARDLKAELISNFSTTIPAKLDASVKGRAEEAAVLSVAPEELVLQRDGQRKEYTRVP
ncbi:hypothetical protein BH09VER1_BH09VER1_30910 [soil metagenome]